MDNWENKALAHSKKEMLGLTQMLSKTVHDINNPLAVMIGQLSIFELMQQRGKLTEDKLEVIIDKLNKSSALFKERLDELRGYYKVSQNNEQFQNLDQILHAVNYYFQNQTYTHHIEFSIECPEGLQVNMSADDLLFCLKSFIQNSIDNLSIEEKEDKYIKVICHSINEQIQFDIEDNGTGLGDMTFEEAMSWGSSSKDGSHSGFGLPMTQMLLDQENTKIQYKRLNNEGKSVFSFILQQKNA